MPGIDQLSTPELIHLVEDLWNHIAADESRVPVPDCHLQVLEERLATLDANPGRLMTLGKLQRRIVARTSGKSASDH